MTVHVNGAAHELPAGSALVDAVALLTTAACGIAVALNGRVVPRRDWPGTPVVDGDRVDVLTAVQGG